MPLIATESGDSWPGVWSSIPFYTTKEGEVVSCKEGHKVIWKGSRITDLECHELGFLKQPAGISHVLHSNKHRAWGMCARTVPFTHRKEPGHMEEERGGSRVPAGSSSRCSHRRAWHMRRTDLWHPNGWGSPWLHKTQKGEETTLRSLGQPSQQQRTLS